MSDGKEKNKKDFDIFIANSVYPDATKIFDFTVSSIEEIKKDCIFVIDTNALLLPYTTSSDSLKEIKKVYEQLIKENRLIIPGQVAREFAKNRPEKLKQIFQTLNSKQSKLPTITLGDYPLLKELSEYTTLKETEKQINDLIKDYRKKILEVRDQVKNWNWDDPISIAYKDIFKGNIIYDFKIDKEKIRNDLSWRYLHNIPPGYKDEITKEDEGIGDLLIWFTILEIGKKEKNVIFVSADEKNDWRYKSDNDTLYPRFELITEFQRESKNKSFHIIKLAELLKLFNVDEKITKEIESKEKLNVQDAETISKIVYAAYFFREINRMYEMQKFTLSNEDISRINPSNITWIEFLIQLDKGFYTRVSGKNQLTLYRGGMGWYLTEQDSETPKSIIFAIQTYFDAYKNLTQEQRLRVLDLVYY